MDKENLFYIIKQGTNQRIGLPCGDPLIVKSQEISTYLREYGSPFVEISIKEFERTFTEQDETQSK